MLNGEWKLIFHTGVLQYGTANLTAVDGDHKAL